MGPEVLDLPGVVLTDQNAASDYVRFYASPGGLESLDGKRIYARDWTCDDQKEYWRRKSGKCAEILVPDCVSPDHVKGAYVTTEAVRDTLRSIAPGLPCTVSPDMFFQL